MTKRDFLAVEDWAPGEIDAVLALAGRIKRGEISGGLERKVMAMVFLDPSLRTRASFETAMFLHGGHGIVLEPGRGTWSMETEAGAVMDQDKVEHIIEAARVLGRYADVVGLRSPIERFRRELEQAGDSDGRAAGTDQEQADPAQERGYPGGHIGGKLQGVGVLGRAIRG